MATWSTDELRTIGAAEELDIASRRPDGILRPYVTIWVVRVGDDVYVRSVNGPSNSWFSRAAATGEGSIRAGGVERRVDFEEPGPDVDAAITQAYRAKYDRYGPAIVGSVVSPAAIAATFRLAPHR